MEHVLLSLKDNNVFLESKSYSKEEELQELIKNNPKIVDLSSIFDNTPIMIIGRETAHIDVLALTLDGVPVIIECKRKENSDMRYLIAQVFEYAAKLNQKSFNDFDSMVTRYFNSDRCREEQYRGLDLISSFTKFREGVAEHDEIDDGTDFRERISERLKNGEFYLLVVVDRISDLAYQTIQFFNRKLNKLRIEIIEVTKFEDGDRKIFIPQHVNREVSEKDKSTRPGKITFEELVNRCNARDAELVRAIKIAWEENEETFIIMGSNGFSTRYREIPMLYVLPNRVQIAPRIKQKYQHMLDPLLHIIEKYFSHKSTSSGFYDSTDINPDKIKLFIEEILNLLKDIFLEEE